MPLYPENQEMEELINGALPSNYKLISKMQTPVAMWLTLNTQ